VTPVKDEAYYAAQAAEASRALAALRIPKIEAASTTLQGVEALIADLAAHRDALGSGPTRDALVNVISVVTSTRSILNGELASLNATQAGGV
jgi:hypothetical protein